MRRRSLSPETLSWFNAFLHPLFTRKGAPNLWEVIEVSKLYGESWKSYPERKEQLHDILRRLHEKNIDLDALYGILRRAKQVKLQEGIKGQRTDELRTLAKIQAEAKSGLVACRQYCEHLYRLGIPEEIQGALKTLSDEMAKETFQGEHRRKRRGNPSNGLAETRRKLSALSIPRETQNELLEAIELYQDRTSLIPS